MMLTPLDSAAAHRAFDRAAASYDRNAVLQQEVAQRLLERVGYFELQPDVVVDLGCGTGGASPGLAAHFPAARLINMDWSMAMLSRARQRTGDLPQVFSLRADMVQLPFAARSVDLVFSNLALDSTTETNALFTEIRRILRPGGLFLFTSYGPETLLELRSAWSQVDARHHVHEFADIQSVGDALVATGFQDPVLDAERITLQYREVITLMRELKAIGASNVAQDRLSGLTSRSKINNVINAYDRWKEQDRFPATFEIIYGATFAPPEGQPRRTPDGDLVEFSVETLLADRRS